MLRGGAWSDEFEQSQSGVEMLAAEAIGALLSGGLPEEGDRAILSVFMGAQVIRGGDFSDWTTALLEFEHKWALERKTEAYARRILEFAGRDPSTENVEFVLAQMDPVDDRLPEWFMRTGMMEIAFEIGANLFDRSWQLIRFPSSCLLTSDRPVVTFGGTRGPLMGFETARLVLFPVAMDTALAMHASPQPESVVDMPLSFARTLNAIVAASAYEWIFHHPQMTPLEGVELPAPEPVFQVKGPWFELVGGGVRDRCEVYVNLASPPLGWEPPGSAEL